MTANPASGRIELGRVSVPSGQLLALDLEAAALWGGDGPPTLPPNVMADDDDPVELVDLKLSGPDAEEVGLILDRSSHPLYLFDVPRDAVSSTRDRVVHITSEHELEAEVEELAERVSHRRRAALQAESGDPAKGIEFHGYWAGLAWDVPMEGALEAAGTKRQGTGDFDGRWQEVVIPLSEATVARSELRGQVSCDSGYLMLVDANVLGGWVHREPIDGKADVIISGLAAAYMARKVGAPAYSPDASDFGWRDLDMGEAFLRATELETMRRKKRWEATVDLRPHSHRELALDPIRGGADAATVDLASASVCVIATGWDEGLFDVFMDVDVNDQPVAVRVVLGTPRAIRASKRAAATNPKVTGLAVISRRAFEDGIGVLYRERPHTPEDSGWRLFRGQEEASFLDDTANVRLVSLNRIVELEPKLAGLLDAPEGAAYEKIDGVFKRMDT